MTINKSQAQSLSKVGLYMTCHVFTHGQLYNVVSRVTSKRDLKVVVCDEDSNISKTTANVVYKEVLIKIQEVFMKQALTINLITETLKVLMEARPELSMTTDISNTTFLHTTATQGNIDVMNYLLEIESSLASIARSNWKTTLHPASRNGHHRVVEALLEKAPGILGRNYKGQTALRMVAKGQNH
ncbi:ankyrin repeat-containing protein [Tanacetum coccineum]